MDIEQLAARGRREAKRVINRSLLIASRRPGYHPPDVSWLFVATLPNSGSTALSRFLTNAPHVHSLRDNGEAQLLVPEMMSRRRWESTMPLDYDLVRAVWYHQARRRAAGRPALILEKSPPNMVRMVALLETFRSVDPALLIFTREPLAICASWAKRYRPGVMRTLWYPEGVPPFADEDAYHREIGRVCGLRMSVLADLRSSDTRSISYERLTEDPGAVLRELSEWCPALQGVDPQAAVSGVKDYAPQPLRNMNDEQIATLAPRTRELMLEGLRPYADVMASFGYLV